MTNSQKQGKYKISVEFRRNKYTKITQPISFLFSWRCFYYTSVFLYGVLILWNKPWLWDIKYCWYNYPHHSIDRDVWYYYMVELSFYWALCISQFIDVKRKDFWEMFIHHLTTIALMAFSWTCNLTRVGTLVLGIHDCADIFLEVKLKNNQRLRSKK